MKAFLTGASGFVGGHVLRLLLGEGARVTCLVRDSSPRRNLEDLDDHDDRDVKVAIGDLRDRKSIERSIKDCDTVFHCAADYRLFVRRPQEMYDSNVEGTRNLLQVAGAAGVRRIVHTSSVGALGLHANQQSNQPADESTPVSLDGMIGHYKRSKYLAERVAEQEAAKGVPVVIVNPSTPVGEGDLKPTATGRIILDFLNRKVPAFVDTGLNLIDVRDVAKGHLLALEKGRIGEKYILGNRDMTLREIFGELAQITGLTPPRVRLPHWVPLGVAGLSTAKARLFGGEPRVPLDAVRMSRHKMFFSAQKAVEELGLPQSSIEDALKRAVTWFEDNGYVRSVSRRFA